MYKLKKISLESVALYSFSMIFVFSLLIFLPLGLIMSAVQSFIPDTGQPNPFFGGFTIGFGLIMAAVYAVLGTILNVILAAVYNLISIKFGGIGFYIKKTEEENSNFVE
jgi:predicted Co/Zn/Cd cation transporter (cation efflux family)